MATDDGAARGGGYDGSDSAVGGDKASAQHSPPKTEGTASEAETYSTATWLTTAEKLGKHVMLGTIVVYSVGFAVAAMHYSSAGVPTPELSHYTCVGAGLLFLAVNAIAISSAQWVAHLVRLTGKGRYGRKALLTFLAYLLASNIVRQVMDVSGFRNLLPFHGYFAAAFGGAFLLTAVKRRPGVATEPQPIHVYQGWSNNVAILVLAVTLFSTTVFPHVLPAFGGGSPVLLFASNRGAPAPAVLPPVAQLKCLPETVPPECRVVSLVYASGSHLYFSIEERTVACSGGTMEAPGVWPHMRETFKRASDVHFCFVRLSDADVKELRIASY
jgi:hypothetical protein